MVAGPKTDPALCQALTAYAREWAHPVQAQDTPGFIVNHAGRGFGTEALRIVSEGVADFATIDRILRDQVGFKLGPFELMDLTALDVAPRDGIHLPPVLRRAALSPQRHHGTRLAGGWWARKWEMALPLRKRCGPGARQSRPVPVVAKTYRRCGSHPERRDAWSCTSCSGPGRHHRDRCIALTHCHHLVAPLGLT